MLAAYIFSVVLGGGFLLISVLGDIFGGDTGDLDMGGHLDVDVGHLELDAGDVGDVDVHIDGDVHGDATHASKILSLRTIVYAMFGFGAVGTILSGLGAGGAVSTFIFALVGGGASGALVNAVFGYLRRTESGGTVGDDTFVGLSGTVTLPVSPEVPGLIAVERGARRIALRALPHATAPQGDPSAWKTVLVVEMEGGVARVAPIEEELLLES